MANSEERPVSSLVERVARTIGTTIIRGDYRPGQTLPVEAYSSATVLASMTGLSSRSVQRYLKSLREKNRIIRIGSDKGGYWQVNG